MTRGTICGLALIAGLATAALADDRNPPPWRGQDNSVFAEYINNTGMFGGQLDLMQFEWWDLTPGDQNFFNDFVPPTDPALAVNHVYNIELPNFIDDLPIKLMRIQVTWFNTLVAEPPELDVIGFDPTGPVTATGLDTPAFDEPGYRYWDVVLMPNPDFELITIEGNEFIRIDQVVIDTISIPAPGVLALAGIGVIAARRRR